MSFILFHLKLNEVCEREKLELRSTVVFFCLKKLVKHSKVAACTHLPAETTDGYAIGLLPLAVLSGI